MNIQANSVKQKGSHENHQKTLNIPMAVTLTIHVPPATSRQLPWLQAPLVYDYDY